MRPVDASVAGAGLLAAADRDPEVVVRRQDRPLDLLPPGAHRLAVTWPGRADHRETMLLFSPGRDRVAAPELLGPRPMLLGGPDLAAAVDLRLDAARKCQNGKRSEERDSEANQSFMR